MKNAIKSFPFLLAIFYLPIFSFPAGISWHDSQRYGCTLLTIYSLFFYIVKCRKTHSGFLIPLLILTSLISIFFAKNTLWALTEFCIFIGLSSFLFTLNDIAVHSERKVKILFFAVFMATVISISWKFLLHYALAVHSKGSMDFWQLISGFNNPRFFGQFCAIAIPLLSIPLCFKFKWKALYFIIISFFASIAFASGTRGTLLGLLMATAVILIYSEKRYVFLKNLSLPLIAGFFIHLIALQAIPLLLEVQINNNSLERLTLNLSARDILWWKSLDVILKNPLFGIGPMHFAAIDSIAAHPHQAILQIAVEYGLIALAIIVVLLVKISKPCISTLRNKKSSVTYSFLCGSVVSALGQSMVDGVFVMPYTLICLFICLSFLNIEHRIINGEDMFSSICKSGYKSTNRFIALLAIFILALSLYPPSPTSLQSNQTKEFKEFLKPRFWLNGTI